MLKGIKAREYQENIYETCKNNNCLVVIPTGLGKTLIALQLAIERLRFYPKSKILFLAPTRPLVEQHYNYFKKYSEFENTHIFTGKINAAKRKEIWKDAQIIFSTPQCIQNDLKRFRIDLKEVSLLIEDECHRCLKNYSYTFVAKKYKEQAKHSRILGLTASPASDPKKIKEICNNLEIEAVEIRTRQSEDVKPYLQELTQEIIKVDFPEELNNIRILLKNIYDKKVKELQNRKLLFKRPTKTHLIELQGNLIKTLSKGNKNFNVLKGMSVCAQAIKIQHALELLETQTLETLNLYMKELYEQARKGKSKAVKNLTTNKNFQDAYLLVMKLHGENFEHPKLIKLKEILEKQFRENFKVLIFSQYRDTVAKINSELTSAGFKSNIFIGQSSRRMDGLTQKEQQLILHKFKQGEINFMISTSIGEEGLDIPEVDLVVFYEPIPSAIRKIQRAGRTARLKPGKLTILMAKGTRDEAYYWAAFHKERKMHENLQNLQDELNKKPKNTKEKDQKDFSDF